MILTLSITDMPRLAHRRAVANSRRSRSGRGKPAGWRGTLRQCIEALERRDLLSIGLAVESAGVLPVPFDETAYPALEQSPAAAIGPAIPFGTAMEGLFTPSDGVGEYLPEAGTGSISGKVYRDENGNHRQDAHEPGLSNWTVFLDESNDSQPDPDEVRVQTNKNGAYEFTGLDNGFFRVFVALKDNGVATVPVWNEFSAAESFPGTQPVSIAAGDFDGDTDVDLAVANYFSSNLSVLKNDGSGSFAPAASYPIGPGGGSLPRSVTAGDFDGDGRPDLAVADEYSGNVFVLRNRGNGTFEAWSTCPVGASPSCVITGDFDGVSGLDMAATNFDSNNLSILRNLGDGTFAPRVNYPLGANPSSVVTGDFDGVAGLDLAVANFGSGSVSVLRNAGDGTFGTAVPYDGIANPTSITAGDLNGDGRLDLAATSFGGALTILWNSGDGTFPDRGYPSNPGFPCAITSADIDGDRDQDLIVARLADDMEGRTFGDTAILRNRGAGSFDESPSAGVLPPSSFLCSVAAADLNGDGTLDLAAAYGAANEPVSVLLSTLVQGGYQEAMDFGEVKTGFDFGVWFPRIWVDNAASGAPIVAGKAGDWFVDVDTDGSGTLTTGDKVTWLKDVPAQAITGLTFGADAFNSIQAAIQAARPGYSLYLGPGTFTESITVDRSLTLLGAQAGVDPTGAGRTGGETVIDGGGAACAVSVTASNVVIDGFELRNSKTAATDRRGVSVAPALDNVRIINNRISNADQGIVVGAHAQNVVIKKNLVSDCWIGVRASDYSGTEVAPAILGNRIVDCATGVYLAKILGSAQAVVSANQFEGVAAGATGWGLMSWEGSFLAQENTFTNYGKAATTWLHGGAIAALNVHSGAGGPGLRQSVIEANTFTCKDGSAVEGIYCDFLVRNNTITKQAGAAQKTLWAHMEGPAAQAVAPQWQIEGNTIAGPGSSTSETGIYASGGTLGTSRLSLAGTNTISGFGTGVQVGAKAKAKLAGAAITGNGAGVHVDGGTAFVQACDLRSNMTAGLLIAGGGVVDAGQTGAGTDYTGLGVSTGSNNFSTYTNATAAKAIINDNTDTVNGTRGVPWDVKAENNLFYSTVLASIELVVVHDVDSLTRGYVDFDPPKAALMAAGGERPSGHPTVTITEAEVLSVLDAARSRWYYLPGGRSLVGKLSAVQIVVSDLPDACLGLTEGTTIYLDRDAAGYGWFADLTPVTSREFRRRPRGTDLRAVDARAVDRIDLVTVVAHELGHVAGLDDLARDQTLMNGTLDTGIRRLPGRLEAQAVWAQYLSDLRQNKRRR